VLTMTVKTASTSAWPGKKNHMVTIVGKPNNCQIVSVISQPAAIEGPIANPLSRPHKTAAANSSAAVKAEIKLVPDQEFRGRVAVMVGRIFPEERVW